MTYEVICPPERFAPFSEMSSAEARRHFDWFVSQDALRREVLLNAVAAMTEWDWAHAYSDCSLASIWRWAMPYVSEVGPSYADRAKLRSLLPVWVRKLGVRDRHLSTETLSLAMDIGYYLSEISRRKSQRVAWNMTLNKRGDAPYAVPYLTGFKYAFVPWDLVKACAWSVVKGNDDVELLHNRYQKWAKDLSENGD